MLFDAFARLGGPLDPPPAPLGAALALAGGTPIGLKHLRAGGGAGMPRLRIAFPPGGAVVDLGLDAAPSPLDLEVEGGVPPFTWFVNNVPVGAASLRRRANWMPDGAGFARISVTDHDGGTDSVAVRLK
jgi:penicillin-binding protein 1C